MADIELVIKIPKEKYKRLPYIDQFSLREYIENGTVLPTGHGRLIDADVLVDGMEDDYEFCKAVNATPTIIKADAEE